MKRQIWSDLDRCSEAFAVLLLASFLTQRIPHCLLAVHKAPSLAHELNHDLIELILEKLAHCDDLGGVQRN